MEYDLFNKFNNKSKRLQKMGNLFTQQKNIYCVSLYIIPIMWCNGPPL